MGFRSYLRLFAVAACVVSSASAANIVVNPGFETGDFSSWVNQDWNIIDTTGINGIFPNSGGFAAYTACVGTTCIQPDSAGSNQSAWLYQDLVTVPNTTYTLSFAFAPGNLGQIEALTGIELQVLWGDSATPLTASANGTCDGSTTNCIFDTTDTTNGTTYAIFTINNLKATSALTRLEFLGEQDPAELGLDDISVTPTEIPEPSTFLLIGTGLFGLVALTRRSRIHSRI